MPIAELIGLVTFGWAPQLIAAFNDKREVIAYGTDRAHKGFVCFSELLDEYQPAWFVHGHVHLNYDAKLPRVCTRGNTTVINATERYVFEIPDPDPLQKRKFLWGSAKK